MTSFSERKKRREAKICYSNEKYVGQNSHFVSGDDNIRDNTILMILENDVIL